MKNVEVSVASKSPLIVKSSFKGYELCLNTYVGCQIGCKYCYVRFFIKDENRDWGEFVRIREHLEDKLPKELNRGYFKINDGKVKVSVKGKDLTDKEKLAKDFSIGEEEKLFQVSRMQKRTILNCEARLVIGTMTDPWQPIERKTRLTRKALELILKMNIPFQKVGMFTRSPIVLDDIELIKQLPRPRVHFSITPYDKDIIKLIEPISVMMERRFDTIKKIKEHGVRTHVNIAPAIPILSDKMTDKMAKLLAESNVDEFFIDPMQAYDESFKATKESLKNLSDWNKIEGIVSNIENYNTWKKQYRLQWQEAWAKHGSSKTLPIWCDHVNHVWKNLLTGEELNQRCYGEDADFRNSISK